MKKIVLYTTLMLLLFGGAAIGQNKPPAAPKDSVGKWDYRVGVGTAVESGFGNVESYLGVTPEIKYRFNNQFHLSAGFSVVSSYGLGGRFQPSARESRTLVPRTNKGAVAYAAYVEGGGWVTDRLYLAARVMKLGGSINTIWSPDGSPLGVEAEGFSADLMYLSKRGNTFNFHMSFVNDRSGGLGLYMLDPYYGESPLGCGFGGRGMLGGSLWGGF